LVTVQGKHGSRYGEGKQLEPGTFLTESGADAGVPHHFFGEGELRELLDAFTIVELSPLEWDEIKGDQHYRHSHYVLIVEK
jgi:hypothetical protein